MGQALVSLHREGCIEYISIQYFYECKEENLIDEIKRNTNDLEKALEQWKKVVSVARDTYYELNSYTTKQLVMLRKNLPSSHLFSDEFELSEQTIALLRFLDPCSHSADINEAVKNSGRTLCELIKPTEEPTLSPACETSGATNQIRQRNQSICQPSESTVIMDVEGLVKNVLTPAEKAAYSTLVETEDYPSTNAFLAILFHILEKNKDSRNECDINEVDDKLEKLPKDEDEKIQMINHCLQQLNQGYRLGAPDKPALAEEDPVSSSLISLNELSLTGSSLQSSLSGRLGHYTSIKMHS